MTAMQQETVLEEMAYGVWLSYVRSTACSELRFTLSEAGRTFTRENMRQYAHLSPVRAMRARLCNPTGR